MNVNSKSLSTIESLLFQYNSYPIKAQKKAMYNTLDLCRWTYNETLALRKNAWETEQKNIGYTTNLRK
jgi:putative transposase